MLEHYGGAVMAVEMAQTWHIFGDASVQLRTDTPESMTVVHDSVVNIGATSFDVTVGGEEEALCALFRNDSLFGSAYTDTLGYATINIDPPLMSGDITLTVTAYNKIPYIDSLPVSGIGMEEEPPVSLNQPKTYGLSKNYPDPCGHHTVINYQVPCRSKVSLRVYDVSGRLVNVLTNGVIESGYHSIRLDTRGYENGIYFYCLAAGGKNFTRKMIVVK